MQKKTLAQNMVPFDIMQIERFVQKCSQKRVDNSRKSDTYTKLKQCKNDRSCKTIKVTYKIYWVGTDRVGIDRVEVDRVEFDSEGNRIKWE